MACLGPEYNVLATAHGMPAPCALRPACLRACLPVCRQREEGPEEAEARLGRVMGHPAPRIDAGPPQFELKRVCTTGLFGAAFVGPLGHYW